MAIENLKILCQGFSWKDLVNSDEIYKANFFSTIAPVSVTDEIDLTNYLLELGKLEYQFDAAIQSGDGTNELFFLSSDIDISLTNLIPISNNYTLNDFFKIKDDTSFIKYKLQILNNNKLIFLGIIDQDGIEITFANSNSSNIIKCNVLGYEKEFVEYYKNDLMKHNDEIVWGNILGIPTMRFQETRVNGTVREVTPEAATLKSIIEQNFLNTLLTAENIRLENGLEKYIILQSPFFYKADNNSSLMWAKTSYERVSLRSTDQAENKWNWLKRMCNGMGWVIFFFIEDEKFCMGIKNRSSINLPTTTLDVGNFQDYKILKDKPNMTFNQIVLIDGTLIGSDNVFQNNANLKGEQLIVISDYVPQNYKTSFFSSVDVTSTSGFPTSYTLNFNEPYTHYYNENGDNFNYSIYSDYGDNQPDLTSLSKKKSIFVDVGFTREAQFVNINNGNNGSGFTIGITPIEEIDDWFVYGGCYANMLLKRHDTGGWQSYFDYVKTDTFYNNFTKFRNTKSNKKFSGTYVGLLTPFQQFKLINDENGLILSTDIYSIQSMSFDLINDTTQLDLYAVNNQN